MARKAAKSYDDIVRQVVVDPDSSRRPSRQQEIDSFSGRHHLRPDEQALEARVHAALIHAICGGTPCPNVYDVELDVEDEAVTIRGSVPSPDLIDRIGDVVARVPGVEEVSNLLVVKR
jgi:hypothetical protein